MSAQSGGNGRSVGTLCTGLGTIDLALERSGWDVRWQAEIDPYCCEVLAEHWPDIPNIGDITTTDWSTVERVDLIAAGYPCQPFSQAGARRGDADERHLWPFVRDALGVLRPRMALLENVPGHVVLGFDTVLSDLADLGFDAEWSLVSACAVGAPHTRERLFVLAHAQGDDGQSYLSRDGSRQDAGLESGGGRRRAWREWWLSEPAVGRVAYGVPRKLVNPPLRAIGNATVPAVVELVAARLPAHSGRDDGGQS